MCRTLDSPVVLNLVLHCANSLCCSMAGSISRLWGVLLFASVLGSVHMIALFAEQHLIDRLLDT